jgi:hypothetical protein
MELSVQLRSGSPVPVVAVGGELDLESGLYLAGWLRWLLQARVTSRTSTLRSKRAAVA